MLSKNKDWVGKAACRYWADGCKTGYDDAMSVCEQVHMCASICAYAYGYEYACVCVCVQVCLCLCCVFLRMCGVCVCACVCV